MKFFIDKETYYQGKLLPPVKRYLTIVDVNEIEDTAHCVDEDGDEYTLPLKDIYIE